MNGIEVRIPKEIKEYQEKLIFGMSLRQLASMGVAIAVNNLFGIVFIMMMGFSMDVVSWLMILCSLPIVSFGWFRKNGMRFEVYMKHFFVYHFSSGKIKGEEIVIETESEEVETTETNEESETGQAA